MASLKIEGFQTANHKRCYKVIALYNRTVWLVTRAQLNSQ